MQELSLYISVCETSCNISVSNTFNCTEFQNKAAPDRSLQEVEGEHSVYNEIARGAIYGRPTDFHNADM